MKKNIFFSIMVVFLFATTFSSAVSYILSNFLTMQDYNEDIRADMLSLSETFSMVYTSSDISGQRIADELSSSVYSIEILDSYEIAEIPSSTMTKLEMDNVVLLSKPFSTRSQCYFMAEDLVVRITPNTNGYIIQSRNNRIEFLLLSMIIFSVIIMSIAGRNVTNPIRKLTKATQKVANGDFDVFIEVDDDNNSEVAQLSRSFNNMVTELKSNEMLKNDFISNVSHEFKTPLATVSGFAKLLQSGNCTPQEEKEYIDIIRTETDRLTVLCSNILKLSKIENQTILTKTTEFSLDEQIRNTILLMESQWEQKDLELEIDLDPVTFNGDEELLQQVWSNLIGNAIKFTHKGGTVAISLKSTPELITVKVSDNGIGMSEETQKHIFEKFYQGDTSHAAIGNGLGLAIVKRIIDMNGGTIAVESRLGEGSVFTVQLKNTNI